MKKTGSSFIDIVSGIPVYEYVDCFGDKYLAYNQFGQRCKKMRKSI